MGGLLKEHARGQGAKGGGGGEGWDWRAEGEPAIHKACKLTLLIAMSGPRHIGCSKHCWTSQGFLNMGATYAISYVRFIYGCRKRRGALLVH